MILNNFYLITSFLRSRKRKNKIRVLNSKILPIIDILRTIREIRICKKKESQEKATNDKIFRHKKAKSKPNNYIK